MTSSGSGSNDPATVEESGGDNTGDGANSTGGDNTDKGPVMTSSGPGSNNPATVEENGDTGEVKESEQPEKNESTGYAYLMGDNDQWVKYENGEGGNAIQQAVNAALEAGKNSVTVVVQDGTYTGGINIDNSGTDASGNAKPSVVVNIVAHDAYNKPADAGEGNGESVYPVPTTDTGAVDSSALNSDSAGGVKLEGGVSVQNVELILAGIYLSLKEQKENQGLIESVLGEGSGNVDINVKDADNFTYYGTAQGDNVNISLTDVENTTINSGDGDDVLNISTSTTPNVQLDTGKTNAELNNQFAGAASVNSYVTVTSGAGSDKITVTGVSAVSHNENIVSVHKGVSSLTVDAGDDADTITLKGDSKLVDIKKDISEEIANRVFAVVSQNVNTQGQIDKHGSVATVMGGDGDDLLNLDTSFELGTLGKTSLDYQGGAGKNRLHLTGSLKPGASNITGSLGSNGTGSISMHTGNTASRIDKYIVDTDLWVNSREVSIDLISPNTLDLSMSGVDTVTDELNNKATVNVTIEGGKVMANGEEVTFQPFTDYIYDPDGNTVKLDSFSNAGCAGALLSKLHIKGQNITVGENTVINLPGVTLVLESVDGEDGSILIKGTVEAENIMLKLTCSDSHALSFFGLVDDIMDPSIMDVNSSVSVIIAATASLIANRVVDIAAKSVQTHGLLPNLTDLIPGIHNLNNNEDIKNKVDKYVKTVFGFESFEMLKQAGSINLVSIKMASAIVDILGSIVAGSVRVSANSEVDTSASNSSLTEFGLPLALSVITGKAGIKVSDGASIQATAGDIYLDANSKVKVETAASSGRLPFTVAVTVVDNKAYVDVSGGSLKSTNGDVIANATGTVEIKTEATGGGAQSDGNNNNVVTPSDNVASNNITQLDKGKSGGFFAISVLNQDVFSALQGTASADAGGNISINSTAKASVVNKAESNPAEDGDSMTLAKLLKTIAGDESVPGDGGLVGTVVNGIKGYFEGKKNQSLSEEEKAAIQKKEDEKTNALGRFVDKLTGKDKKEEGVGSLVDQATSSANTGKTDSTNTVQMVGSLAVTYADNNNRAFVDTTGLVQAGGNVSVVANGEMKVETLADGSPVKADDPAAGEEKDGPQDQHYAAHNHGAVKVDKLTNGTIYIDAAVGEDGENIYKIEELNNFPKGIENYDVFNFVVKASFGYTLKKAEDGKYYVTNEYKNVMDGSLKKEQIELVYVGKDADGCHLYKSKDEGYGGYKLHSGDNLLKAEFVPQNSITVNNSSTALGTVTVTDAQKDGKNVYFAGHEDVVYVTINLKSGVKFTAPVITYLSEGYDEAQPYDGLKLIDKDGNPITDLSKAGDVQKDGTTNYYYMFAMPNGKVTMNVALTGEKMEINVDEKAKNGATVWFAPADETPTAQDTYEGNVGEKIKIVIQLPKVTEQQLEKQLYLVTNSLVFAGKTPVFIKDISYDGNGQYTCYANIPAILKTEGNENAGNKLTLSFKTTTDPNSAQKTVEDSSTALGAGLAVDVTRYNNQAYIANTQNGTINAGGIEVKANTANLDASAISKAGFVAGDVGVAGAITVHLVSANNEALIGGSMNKIMLNGGNLIVDSVITNSNIVTNAEAAGDGKTTASGIDRDSVGVGAGIAVGVTNLVAHSQILDRVMINGTIGNMDINAGHTGTESMKASAGASGGTSAVPVLALNISGVSVLANSGMLNNVLNLTGNALVSAANSITREITADAAAVGSGVGVGASFIIDILRDSAKAKLGRSVNTTGDLTVSAESISRLNATAKSGAKGSVSDNDGDGGSDGGDGEGQPSEEPPPSAGSDKKEELPDDYYDGLDNLFGDSSDTELDEDEDPESLAPLFREGDADKFVDSNKDSATGLASLVDNGKGNVNSTNVGKAFEDRQKAESSEGSVQVAATMVLNIQNNEALAQIDDVNSIKADGTVKVTSRHDTDGVIMADASATNSSTGVGVAVAINTVTYTNIAEILRSNITAGELVVRADVLEAEAEETSEDLFETIKNDLLKSVDDLKSFVDSIMKTVHNGGLEGFIRDKLAALVNTSVEEAEVKGISALILQWVGELIEGNKPSFPSKEQEDELKTQLVDHAKKIFPEIKENFSFKKLMNLTLGTGGLGGSLSDGLKASFGAMKDKLKGIKDINLKQQATGAIFSYLAGKLGANEEPEGVGPKISTSAVSGAGASNVGVAGSLAISVVNGTNKAYVADVADAVNGQMNVQGNITVESLASQEVFTSAGSSVDALGRVDKNKNATDNANSTQSGSENNVNGKSVGVGAAVALSFADLTSEAGIGEGWTVTAKDLLMNSKAENNVETTSVSGTDPLARTEEPTDKSDEMLTEEEKKAKEKKEAEEKAAKAMDVAADASVSVTLIQNSVRAYLAENSLITLSGNLDMLSSQSGETNTNASGFAMGNDTAVGAAVAINLAFSDVLTQLLGGGSVAGHASMDSRTDNQDDATAVALAMGAEMDRYYAKIRNAEKVKAFNQKMGDTEHEDDKRVRIENETSNKLNNKLQRASKVSDPKDEKKDKSNAAQPLSVQALKSQDVKTESTKQTDENTNSSIAGSVTDASNANTGNAVSGSLNNQAQEGQNIHVAAAVGLNVTEHNAKTEIKGNLTAGGIKADAENSSNFGTASTGAAISEASNSNSIGVAVAVSVNGNKAQVDVAEDAKLSLTAPAAGADEASGSETEKKDELLGNVTLSTSLNQNSTGDALGKYGALAIAGSSSGKGGKVGLAGSLAVIVAKGTSSIILGDNVMINAPTGNVNIAASDMSKLSAAAMAATKSDGAAAGVGASFALLYAENTVLAQAGDNFHVTANKFDMTATKQAVTIGDFVPDKKIGDFITLPEVDKDGNGGYSTDDADEYGMVVIQKNKNGSYELFTNLDTASVLELVQLSSVLASVNYYASAVAGTVMERKGDTTNQKAAVAGSVSMLFNNSVTGVKIGDNAKITTTGHSNIAASSDANARLLGGALSSSGAKTGIGLNVATAKQNEQVYAVIGIMPEINVGSFTVKAHSMSDMLVVTAAAVNSSGTSVGGGLNVVINNNSAKAHVAMDAKVNQPTVIVSDGAVLISADAAAQVLMGSLAVALSDSSSTAASAGAVVTVATNASAAEATVGDGASITSRNEGITVIAINEEQVLNFLIAAGRSADGGAGAGTVSVLATEGKTLAGIGNNAELKAQKDITVSAQSKAKLVELMLAAAAATDAPAVGATIMVNVFNRVTGAYIGNNAVIVSNAGNVLVMADSEEFALIISVAGAAAGGNAISGNVQVNVGNSWTYANVGNNANIKAWDSIGVTANQNSSLIAVSPSVSYASGSNAVGATVQTTVLGSDIKAIIGENAKLIAYAQSSATNGIKTHHVSANREDKRKGVILSALANDLVAAVAISAIGGNNAISGVVETLVNNISVQTSLGANAVVHSGFKSGDSKDSAFAGDPAESEGELRAEADSHSRLYIVGGALSASGSNGIGATVLTLVLDKNVQAQILLSTTKQSNVNGKVNVTAKSENVVDLVGVNFGVSMDTAATVGGNVLIFEDEVNALLSGKLEAGDVLVQADGITEIINFVASVSGGLANTSVSGAAIVTYFRGETVATIGAGSYIICKDLSVLANSSADIDSDGFGVSASVGGAAVSGVVNIIVTSSKTEASVAHGNIIEAENVTIFASDCYDLLAYAANIAGGSNGVGVTAVVTVAKSTVTADVGAMSKITASGNLTVKAVSDRYIRNYAGSVSGGGNAGVGVTVMVAVIGSRLDKDSAEGIATGFDPKAFMKDFGSSVPNAAKDYLDSTDLSGDLESDESKASDMQVGDENGYYNGTDDYRSDDFDGEYNSGSNPGENLPENVGNSDGSELGMAKPEYALGNIVNAIINPYCTITVTGDILVEAAEKLNIDIVTASASGGGTAGVNVGVAVVVANSSVEAQIAMDNTIICDDLTVRALSGREESDSRIDHSTAAAVLNKSGINAKAEGSSIRAIAITVGLGGTAGLAPSVAVVNLASNVFAKMSGMVNSAGVVTVKAETLYPNVLAVTGAIGAGGSAGISASVAVVSFNNNVYVDVVNSSISANELNLLVNVNNTANAYAMSLAGGSVGVNGAVAVVANRSGIYNSIGVGSYDITGNVNVKTNANMAAESFIVGVSLGGVAVGLNAAVVNQHAVIDTGVKGNGAVGSYVKAKNLDIVNDVIVTANSSVIAIVGGGVGVGGNVLLVFNNVDSKAGIINMPITLNSSDIGAGTLTVSAKMNAQSSAALASATVGAVAVGLSTSYVGLNAKNLAYIELDEASKIVAEQINVLAGKSDDINSFSSTATTVAGQAGVVSVGLNAAVADINASNQAKLSSKGEIQAKVNVQACSDAEALAEIYYVSFGDVNVSAATAVSLLRIKQLAEADIAKIDGSNVSNGFNVHVLSQLNKTSNNKIPSHALLVTMGGGVYNASANVAVAYSLSENVARAIIENGTQGHQLHVKSEGSADAKSETVNQSAGAFNGSVFVNVAYARGVFDSILRIMGEVSAKEADIKSNYSSNSTALLTPAASKLNLSLASFNVNLAIAQAAAKALASLEGNGKMMLTNTVYIGAQSSGSKAHANITGASVDGSKVDGSVVSFATNVADSQLDIQQEVKVSYLTVETGESFTANSTLTGVESKAQTGSNHGVKITLVGGNADVAKAVMSLTNKLIVENAKIISDAYVDLTANGYGNKVNAIADAVDASISGITAALTSTEATLKKLVNSVYINGSEISGSSVSVNANSKGFNEQNSITVYAQSSVPSFKGSLVGLDSVAATARIVEKLNQILVNGSFITSTTGDISLLANSNAYMKAGTFKQSVSAGVLSINNYLFNAKADKILTEVIFDGHMDSATTVEMKAYDNIDSQMKMDDSNVGAFSGSSSVVRIDVNNQTAHVKAAGTINAVNNIELLAQADQHLIAEVKANSVNGIEMGVAKTDIILYRNAIVDVDGDIISQLGNIDVKAQLEDMADEMHMVYIDQDINVDTWWDAGSYPTATGKVVSVVKVNVADDSLIQALNVFGQTGGDINIVAKNEGRVMIDIYRYIDKVFGCNGAYAIADVFETVQTIIGGGVKTGIYGKKVNICAQSDMDVRSKSMTVTNVTIGLTFSPNATTIYRLDMDTIIRDADISAQNILNISAYIPATYIEAHCISEKTHLAGYNKPSVVVKGHVYADVSFDKNTTLRANELNIRTFKPYDEKNQLVVSRVAESWYDGSKKYDTHINYNSTAEVTKTAYDQRIDSPSVWTQFSKDKMFISGTYDPDRTKDKNLYYSGSLICSDASSSGKANASGRTDIYLGAGASGVYVNITENDEIQILGLDGSVSHNELVYLKDGIYHVNGEKLLAAVLEGKLKKAIDTQYRSYYIEWAAASNDLTLLNNSGKTVQLDNVNQREDANTKPGAFLNVTQTKANSNLVFNGGGDFSKGAIYVEMAGGDVILRNGAQINAQNITIKGAGAIVDEGREDEKLEIINSGYTGLDSDTSIYIDVAEALNLVLKTENSVYTADYIKSGGDIWLGVQNLSGKVMTVKLGEVISGGDVYFTTANNVQSANPGYINLSGNKVTIDVGGSVGSASNYLRIDSSTKGNGSVCVNANGGIYLKEARGDIFIDKIFNEGSGDIAIWTENGNIRSYIHSNDVIVKDNMEQLGTVLIESVREMMIAADAEDMIKILIQYLKDLHRIRDELLEKGDEVLEKVRWEIDLLHHVSSVEEALELIDGETEIVGGSDYQDPEKSEAIMNGALDEDSNVSEQFNKTMESFLDVDGKYNEVKAGELGHQMLMWREHYEQGVAKIHDFLMYILTLGANTPHIQGNGDLLLHLQSSSGQANVSDSYNTLTVNIGGKLTITAGPGTVLKNVYLESYDDLKLDPIVSTNVIDIYATGSIYAAQSGSGVLLDTQNLTLYALTGHLGTADQKLIIKADLLDALGENVYFDARKTLVVEMLIATGNLDLNVKGDLYDTAENSDHFTGIYGTNLKINVSGNIGGDNAPNDAAMDVSVFAENRLDITAKNMYIHSDGNVLVGQIKADGMVEITTKTGSIQNVDSNSGIWCDGLLLDAYGEIGTDEKPLFIYSDSKYQSNGGGLMRSMFRAAPVAENTLIVNSYLYGEKVHIIRSKPQQEQENKPGQSNDVSTVYGDNGIKVSGNIGEGAVLVVSSVSDHKDCPVCQSLAKQHQLEGRVFVNLKVIGNYAGKLLVQIPANEEFAKYEGKEIVILTCREGEVWAIRARLVNGIISFYTDELGAFLVLGGSEQLELSEDGTKIILDQHILPFGGWI